ncbi:hypothetical protein J7E81_01490 [Bacillus sp. ISL-18]|uniref:hypothetical protein n=1 Tax=Bacillus sp. ISL-18 TaxID=2819118 RepID=UPI001BEA241D|nr:hypothetical protein [Bacillus sp. ISL-18]MBT2653919.1 hypothetical protein [Bacillus sp. ISL-18]
MQRLLNKKESEDVGFAVGTIIEVSKRLFTGDVNFSLEQYEQIGMASEILSKYDEKELSELINLGVYLGVE